MKILNFNSYIKESYNMGDLYHYTTLKNLIKILKDNSLKGKISDDKDDYHYNKGLPYISLTRNKNFHNQTDTDDVPKEIRITLDASKISHNYNIEPYMYALDYGDEYEERIWFKGNKRGVENLSKYIKQIDLYTNFIEDDNLNKSINLIKKELIKLGIELNIDDKDYLDYLEKHKDLINTDYLKYIYNRRNLLNRFEKSLTLNNYSEYKQTIFNNCLLVYGLKYQTSLISISNSKFILRFKDSDIDFELEIIFLEDNSFEQHYNFLKYNESSKKDFEYYKNLLDDMNDIV